MVYLAIFRENFIPIKLSPQTTELQHTTGVAEDSKKWGGSKLHIDDYSRFTLGGLGGRKLTDCTCGRPCIGNSASEGPLRVWEGDVPPLAQSAKENFTFFGGLYFFVVPV